MSEPKLEGLYSEEGKKKAATLFSKKFLEYLTNKKLPPSKMEKSFSYEKTPPVPDFSASSDETSKSESSRKSGRRGRKKLKERRSYWHYDYSFRNRLIQCSLLKNEEEVAPPDDLKPLLMNMTILLQDLRQSSSDLESLLNLISKITTLVTEFIRRPLKKIPDDKKGEHSKSLEKAIETMTALLEEYKNGPNLAPDNSIREYKRIEKEIMSLNHKIGEIKKKLSLESQKNDSKNKDLVLRVRNSILANEELKSEIKFNHSHIKKYKKIVLEKEWTKHKLEIELAHLKKKISKVDLTELENAEKQSNSTEAKSDSSVGATVQKAKRESFPKRGKEASKSIFKPK